MRAFAPDNRKIAGRIASSVMRATAADSLSDAGATFAVLVMATAFTRIVVVLSILRSALGTQTAPPTAVLVSLALFLTAFVMAPTGRAAYSAGIEPLVAGRITQAQAFERASAPFKK